MTTYETATTRGAAFTQVRASTARLSSLTQLRWVAALMVFLYHARNFGLFGTDAGRLADWAFGAGSTGVSLFFVLSGFVIAWGARPGDRAVTFWRRRFARIYPLHLVTALAALLLALTGVAGFVVTGPAETAANLALVSSWRHDWWQALNPVSWSLTCEAFFYAAFPPAYAGLRRLGQRGLEATILAAIAAVLVLAWLAGQHGLPVSLYDFPATRLPEFLAGAAAGLLVRRGQWRGPATTTAAVITTIGYFLTAQLPQPYTVAACTIIGITLLIPALATTDRQGSPARRRTAVAERLGEISYAFYLIHLLVMRCGVWLAGGQVSGGPGRALGWTVGTLAVSVALAWLLHTYVEVPARRWILRRPAGRI